jgi:hypothetical protein
MAKVDEQVAALEAMVVELGLQTAAIQAQTAAIQGQAADIADLRVIAKYQAESIDHETEYMTGSVTHAEPLP